MRPAVVITGPTCSGKSALANEIAHRFKGCVINADSMQVYKDLRVLTARPSPEDEAYVPHALYGVLPSTHNGNVSWWVERAVAELDRCALDGVMPVLCGGTGMYLRALFEGLSTVPPVSSEVRDRVRNLGATKGGVFIKERLRDCDPKIAEKLSENDLVRLCRALEVFEETGRPLSWWQTQNRTFDLKHRFLWIHLDPDKDLLRERIRMRLETMIEAGAAQEAEKLEGLDPTLPIMRAHGVPELIAVSQNRMDLADALDRIALIIGRYTKRQRTWFRHHSLAPPERSVLLPYRICEAPLAEGERDVTEICARIFPEIERLKDCGFE